MRAFRQLYLASLREFRRDFSALFWTLAFPLFFIVIFGVIFSGPDNVSFDIGLVNEDGSASAQLVESFKQIDAFDITVGTREGELQALKDGHRSAVIIIPAGTGAKLGQSSEQSSADRPTAASQAPLEVYYDAANQSSAQVVLTIVDKVIAGINQNVTGITPVLTMDARQVSTTELRSIDYLLPGILAMSLMQLGLFGTAAPLVSLREKGVLRRMGATPLTRTSLLASQVAFRLTLAFVQTAVIVVVGMLLFDVHVELGHLPAIIGMVVLGATTFITFGYFLAGLAKTEEAVQGIVQLPNFIFMFLSGIFFSLDFMPEWTRPLVDVIPLTYLGDALRKLMIDAGSYFSLTRSIAVLLAWLAVSAVLALRFFRWEMEA